MQKCEDIEALQKAKEILESAGMRIDERTPLVSAPPNLEKSYEGACGKNESIAYADLPWADKQTTIAESNGNLFKSRRLNEAMERIFEDATEAGAKQKYEEDFTK